MTIQEAVSYGTSRLTIAEVDTPLLDSIVLLCHTINTSKEQLYTAFYEEVSKQQWEQFTYYIHKREQGIPVSYIREKKEFYGREFEVNEHVLVPRPETETLVDSAIDIVKRNNFQSVHDCCTGSGCIAITLFAECRNIQVSASEISSNALKVFRRNSIKHLGYCLPHVQSDLLADVKNKYECITANPPYLTTREIENMKKIGWPEPRIALDGGNDGIALISPLIRQAKYVLTTGGYLVMEIGYNQGNVIYNLLIKEGFADINIIQDLGGKNRVIKAVR